MAQGTNLSFFANNADSTGNLTTSSFGIGTTTPSSYNARIVSIANNNTGTVQRIMLPLAADNTSTMAANLTNDMLVLNAAYGPNAASVSNAGAKWGIKFVGAGGASGIFDVTNKTCAIYAVSEDALGYNRQNGLAFYTNNQDLAYQEQMRIDHLGNVGIGTTSPANKFEVFGDDVRNTARASTTAGQVLIEAQASNYWSTPTYTGTSLRQYGSTASGTTAGLSNAGLGQLVFQNGTAGLIYTNGGSPIVFGTTSIERMRIDSAGLVAIGTSTTAAATLTIKAGNASGTNPGNVSIYKYFGATTSPSESLDWPTPVLSLRGYGNYFYESMLSFGYANDADYQTGDNVWNFRLDGVASTVTSTVSTGLRLVGPGPLELGAGSSERLRITANGGISFGASGTAYGTTGQKLVSNGDAAPTWGSSIVSGTTVPAGSFTSTFYAEFSIPSWAKRITLVYQGLASNGASIPLVQIGSGSIATAGYNVYAQGFNASATGALTSTAGFLFSNGSGATYTWNGQTTVYNITGNTWVGNGSVSSTGTAYSGFVNGSITLGGVLDRIRLTTQAGNQAFTAGQVNVFYE